MEQKLTVKQNKFVNKYLECGNASEAYRFAYSSENMKNETVNRKAIEVLNNGKITARIKELQAQSQYRSNLSRERILFELECMVDAKATDYANLTGGRLKFTSFKKLNERQIKAIKSVKQGNNGTELELYSKLAAIERICKMLGYDAPEKFEYTGKDQTSIELINKALDSIPENEKNELYNMLKDGKMS